MQRHVLFSAVDRLNELDPLKSDTFVSNGDGISNYVERDLRSDMGGFMHPSKGDYSGRRIAPLSVTPAVAKESSEVGRDLLVRLKVSQDEDAKVQALATKEVSQSDLMHMNFFLDISSLGISKAFKYEKSFNVEKKYFKHTTEEERQRRANLYLNATKSMNDYANQARNAVSGEPQEVIIVFDSILSRKASRYFTAETQERKNILEELDDRKATYFMGDDKGELSVFHAYKAAMIFLNSKENSLYDPSNGAEPITFAKAFGRE